MKAHLLPLLLLAGAATAAQPVLVRVSAEDIRRLHPVALLTALPEAPPLPAAKPPLSLLKESVILHDGKNWTVIPTGAVLHLPEGQAARVNTRPVGNLLPWEAFLTANSSWLATREVTFEQAAGNEKFPASRMQALRKSGKVIVATHRGGPITIRLPE